MPPTKGIKITKDAVMVGADINTAIDNGVQIPQTDTSYGAGFGDIISDTDRAFAAEREPVAHFLTYGVAQDITEKWFKINDPDTTEQDPELDRSIQEQLSNLEAKKHVTDAITFCRIFGEALLVGGFTDAQTPAALGLPLQRGSELKQLHVYPTIKGNDKTNDWMVWKYDENPMSNRFLEPEVYKLHRGQGSYIYVHWTRVFHLKNNSNCSSILDPIWDDLVCGRNIRWGASQWMYRTGSGFACIGFPAGTTAEQLEAYHNSGAFGNLMSRTALFYSQNSTTENDGITIDFKGVAGHALDPTPFFQTNLEQISVATGIPQAKLRGAQAGQVTGSEVNMQDYFKVISREQAKMDNMIRWIIDNLSASQQLSLIKSATDYRHKTVGDYEIEWVSAFELSALQEADIDLKTEQANQARLDYMTIDEVRATKELDPLPNGEGESLKQQSMGLFNEEKGQEGNEQLAGNDKFLVVDLNRSKRGHKHGHE